VIGGEGAPSAFSWWVTKRNLVIRNFGGSRMRSAFQFFRTPAGREENGVMP